MAQAKKGLGRGLAALIPTDDMDFLSGVARGDFDVATIEDNFEKIPKPNSQSVIRSVRQTSSSKIDKPIDSAISDTPPLAQAETQSFGESSNEASPLRWLTADTIVANPYQPRRTFDEEELQNLSDSIREHGILQPIIVRPVAHNDSTADAAERFQLVAGERRWRAAQLAGLSSVPAIVKPVDDQQALELAVIENVQRHDISPLDAAQAYRRLATEFELSQEKIAIRVGKSRSAIANTMRLLELPIEARDALQDGTLSEGHGRAILLAPGEGARRAAFRAVLRDKLSVRDTEELARRIAAGDMPTETADEELATRSNERALSHAKPKARSKDQADYQRLAEHLQNATGCRVQFRPRRKGGQFIIHCSSSDDVSRLSDAVRQEDKGTRQ